MSAFSLLISPHKLTLLLPRHTERSATPTTQEKMWAVGSVTFFSPETFSMPTNSTSALVRVLQRMAASKPTSWLSVLLDSLSHSESASGPYRTVKAVPFLTVDLRTHSLSSLQCRGIRSLPGGGKALDPPNPNSALPPLHISRPLYLNRFRGKPAISKFDWPFTPNHTSSPPFATGVSSVLLAVVLTNQPVHD